MLKSLITAIVAILAATFGLHHASQLPAPAQQASQHAGVAAIPATYELTIVNDYFATPTTLSNGTRFKNANGEIFRSQQPFTVPGKRGAVNGTITISADAVAPGAQPTGRLTLPGLAASPNYYAHIYAQAARPAPAADQTASAASTFDVAQQSPASGDTSNRPQYPDLSSAQNQESTNNTTQQNLDLSSPQQQTPSTQTPGIQTPSTRDTASVLNEVSTAQPTTIYASDLAALQSWVRGYVAQATSSAATVQIPEYIAAGGNGNPFAESQAINQLSNITVSGVKGLTAGDIPALNYLSASGGSVSGLSQFTNASTTLLSVTNKAYFGGTATSTFDSAGNLSVAGTLTVSGVSTHTGLASFNGNASTTELSAYGPAYFGATATSTFGTDGSLTLAKALGVASGGTGTTTWQTGSIPFFNGISFTENNSKLFWDNTNGRLGIATTSPATTLSVSGNGYLTGGLGVGVLNTTAGTLQTSGDATVGGALNVSGILTQTNQIRLKSQAPLVDVLGQFGSWAYGTDQGGTVPYSDFYLAYKCIGMTESPGDCATGYDVVYANNNQDGLQSAIVVSGGTGYNNRDVLTLNTSVGTFTGSISGTTLTVSSISSNFLAPGQAIIGTGVSTTTIISQLTGTTGGVGTYQIKTSQTISSETITANDCIVPPELSVTNASGGVIQSGGVSVYSLGGYGRCEIDPSGTLSVSATTGAGSGATVTGTFSSNFPTFNVGGSQSTQAITAGLETFASQVFSPSANPEYGGLLIQIGNDTGDPLRIKSNSATSDLYVDDTNALHAPSGTITYASSTALTASGTLYAGLTADLGSSYFNYVEVQGANNPTGGVGAVTMQTKENGSAAAAYLALQPSKGNVGIGTTSPSSRLTVWGPDTASTTAFAVVNSASTTVFAVYDTGNANVGGTLTVGGTSAAFLGQTVNAFGGLQFGIAAGSLSAPGGTMSGYNAGDTATVQCTGVSFSVNPIVGITAVSGGAVTDYTLSQPGVTSGAVPSGSMSCSQSSTSGSGTGLTFTASLGVIASYLSIPALATGGAANNGNLLINNAGIDTPNSTFAGSESTFFGDKAGSGITGGAQAVTAVGHNACGSGGSGTSQSNLVCIGTDAGRNIQGNVAGSVVIGAGAGRNLTGGNNVIIGSGAAGSNGANSAGAFTGAGEVVIGENAGKSLTTGNFNLVVIGQNVGANTLTSGSNDILIGTQSGVDTPAAGTANFLNIGNLVFGTGLSSNSSISGNVGIATATPSARLTVWGPDTASTTAFNVVNSASTTVFAVYDSGNSTYSGSIFQSSDQRLKEGIQTLDASSSLAAIEQLNPVSYMRIDQPGQGDNLGFIAQQVGNIFPELVSTTSPTALTPDGTLTLNYTGLIAPIIAAIKALASELASLETTVAGFAQSITTHLLAADTVQTQQLCVGSTCVTPAQFQAMVAAAGQTGAQSGQGSGASGDSATSSPDTPPVLQINGDNPATINVGATYNDLGATITGPAGDLNLGIKAIVDGEATTTLDQITIDTSQPATHTIRYVATDQPGQEGTATRTVDVVAPPMPPTDDSASTTTTAATSTSASP